MVRFQTLLPNIENGIHDLVAQAVHPKLMRSARRVLREYFGPYTENYLRTFGIHLSSLSLKHPPFAANGHLVVVRRDGEGKIFTREGNYLLELEKGVSGDCRVIVYEECGDGRLKVNNREDFTRGNSLENQRDASFYVSELRERIKSGNYTV